MDRQLTNKKRKVQDDAWDNHLPPVLNSKAFWLAFIAATFPFIFIYAILTDLWDESHGASALCVSPVPKPGRS
jgi:hypothetical protein